MDNGIWIGALAAFSALAGAAISQWGAGRLAGIHSKHQADRDSLLRSQALQDQQAAVLACKREAFLGYVLLVRGQVEWMANQAHTCLPESVLEHPTSVARQAYAVALLYLADMHPLAVVFYETTARLQQALLGADDAAAIRCNQAWVQSFKEIEGALAKSRLA
jgi:hypothetical protein